MFGLFKRHHFIATRVDGPEARELVHEGARIIDVRTPGEFAGGSVDGAINVPLQSIVDDPGCLRDPSRVTVLYCRSGQRSARAGGLLRERGHRSVYDLGPMSAWHRA